MKLLPISGTSARLVAILLVGIAVAVVVLGWEPSPLSGQVRVCRSQYHRAGIPFQHGMTVKDAIARSRAILGEAANESVVVYHWRPWLVERIPDATVIGLQGALGFAGLHAWSDALWRWWDSILPRQPAWREVARDDTARDRLLESGEMIVLHTGR